MLKVGMTVRIISLEATEDEIGLDGGGEMRDMLNDGKIYVVHKVVDEREVLLNKTYYYCPDDLEIVSGISPYKKAKIEPQLFDIKNLE